MILILDYNNSKNEFLNEVFEANKIDYQYSMLENKIISSEKIILPHPINFNSCYRKLNMTNLFNLFKLVKKPILGINDGFHLMCNCFEKGGRLGLGFFEIDVNLEFNALSKEKYVKGNIGILENSKLVSSKLLDHVLAFNPDKHNLACKYSSSFIRYNETEYSFTYENENYYGVEIDIEKNESISREIITNFINI